MKLLFELLFTISLVFGIFGANIRIPRDVKEFACPPGAEDGFYPADDQCTGSYYYCNGGIASPLECPCGGEGQCTVFDPVIDACVDPEDASCGGFNGTALPPTGTDSEGSSTSGLETSATTKASVATSVSSLPPYTCPGDGFYPIPGTCGQEFYICAGDIVGSGVCPEGSLFDPVTYKCTPADETTCNMPFNCPAEEGFFPYPGGCSAVYYICIEGEGFIQYCPENTIFDPILLACVREPSCIPGELSTTQSIAGTTDASTEAVPSETTFVTETPESSTIPFVCPSDGNFPIFGECKSYYICAGGSLYVVTCPGDLVFNAATSNCDYPANVPECATGTTLADNF